MTNAELNEVCAKKLGWISDSPHGWIRPKPHKEGFLIGQVTLPNYVGSIEAAWEIAEYVENKGPYNIRLKYDISLVTDKWIWSCRIAMYDGEADTAPEAIVRAFLKLP